MKSRQEKINYLKGLINGRRSIAELSPPRVILFTKQFDNAFYIEATYPTVEWTDQDIEAHRRKYPKDTLTVIYIGHPRTEDEPHPMPCSN